MVRLVLFICWLCFCGLATAADEPWAEAARQHVQTVLGLGEKGKVLTGTALSPFSTEESQTRLRHQWNGVLNRWKERSPRVTILKSRREGDLAAVILEILSEKNALTVQVLGMVAVLRDEQWIPGPTLGSFRNINLGYDDDIVASKRMLESWISRERSEALATATARSEGAFQRQVADEEKKGFINSPNPRIALSRFFEACRTKDLAAVMAFQGGIDRPLPEDYEQSLAISRTMLESPTEGSYWEDLTDPQSVAVPFDVQREGDGATASVILWRPEKSIVSYEAIDLERLEDNWRIFVPERLSQSGYEEDFLLEEQEIQELDQVFPSTFRQLYGSKTFDSPISLGEAVAASLRSGMMRDLGCYLNGDRWLDTVKLSSFDQLRRLWLMASSSETKKDAHFTFVLPDRQLFVIAVPTLKSPRSAPLYVLRYVDSAGKVSLHGQPLLPESVLTRDQQVTARQKAADYLMAGLPELSEWPSGSPPVKARVIDTVQAFWDKLAAGQVGEAHALCTRLPIAGSGLSAAEYLGALAKGLDVEKGKAKLLGAHREGSIAAVSMRIPRRAPAPPEDYLICVIQGDSGPQVLADVDLRYPHNTGRRILNDRVWRRLHAGDHRRTLNALQALYADHLTLIDQQP